MSGYLGLTNLLNAPNIMQKENEQQRTYRFVLSKLLHSFEFMNYRILFAKLSAPLVLEWTVVKVHDFVANRTFSVRIKDAASEENLVPCGVPQRSVIAPPPSCLVHNQVSSDNLRIYLLLFLNYTKMGVSP